MRSNKKHKSNGHSNANTGQLVQVKLSHTAATAVAIAGTFNNWRPEASPMAEMGEGEWLKELVLPSGTYEYLFVADGTWLPDPLAKETVPNPFGGVNSVITVPQGGNGNAR